MPPLDGELRPCKMLVRKDADGHIIEVTTALNPDGSPADAPPGFEWIDATSESWEWRRE